MKEKKMKKEDKKVKKAVKKVFAPKGSKNKIIALPKKKKALPTIQPVNPPTPTKEKKVKKLVAPPMSLEDRQKIVDKHLEVLESVKEEPSKLDKVELEDLAQAEDRRKIFEQANEALEEIKQMQAKSSKKEHI